MITKPHKYKSAEELQDAIEHYFMSISYTTTLHGEDDELTNDLGEPIRVRKFAVPPTTCGMCVQLGIDRSTWSNYCDPVLHPEFQEVTHMARAVLEGYLEEELTKRTTNVSGLKFNLQNNFGWREKKEVEIGAETRGAVKTEGVSLSDKLAVIAEAAQSIAIDGGANEKD